MNKKKTAALQTVENTQYNKFIIEKRGLLEEKLAHSSEFFSGTLITVSGIVASLLASKSIEQNNILSIFFLILSVIVGIFYQLLLVSIDEELIISLDKEFPTFYSKLLQEYKINDRYLFIKISKLIPISFINNVGYVLLVQMFLVLLGFYSLVFESLFK